jgi:phosphate transport system substrate-binding protein
MRLLKGIGVFGLSFLLNNVDKLYAAKINGVEPSTETIASGEYPVSRPLQFYVKNAHVSQVAGIDMLLYFLRLCYAIG